MPKKSTQPPASKKLDRETRGRLLAEMQGRVWYSRDGDHVGVPVSDPDNDRPAPSDESHLMDVLHTLEWAMQATGSPYIRVVPGRDGKGLYVSLNWRDGPWRGHYILAVVHADGLAAGLAILAWKANRVAAGELRPSKDGKTYQT